MHPRRIDARDVGLILDGDRMEDFADRVRHLAGGFLAFAEGEDRWAGTGDREPEGSRREGGPFGFVEVRYELLAAGLGDHVVDRA